MLDARRSSLVAERKARAAKLNLLEQEVISPALPPGGRNRRVVTWSRQSSRSSQTHSDYRGASQLSEGSGVRAPEGGGGPRSPQARGAAPVLEAYVKDTEVVRQREAEARRSVDDGKSTLTEVRSEIARVADSKNAAQQVLEIGSIGGDFSELLRTMRAQLPVTAQLDRNIWDRDQAIVDARLGRLQAEEAAGHSLIRRGWRKRSSLQP